MQVRTVTSYISAPTLRQTIPKHIYVLFRHSDGGSDTVPFCKGHVFPTTEMQSTFATKKEAKETLEKNVPKPYRSKYSIEKYVIA